MSIGSRVLPVPALLTLAVAAVGCGDDSGSNGADMTTPGAGATGGANPAAGSAGSSNGNTANMPGASGECDISATASLSPAIGSVGIVEWTAGFDVQEAKIEFAPTAGGTAYSAPVDLSNAMYRTLMLGMKQDTEYTWRVVATNTAGESCTSADQTLMTDPAPNSIPPYTFTGEFTPGFIVITQGAGNLATPGGAAGSGGAVFVIDSDGDIVWWTEEAPTGPSAAHMDFEGNTMYMMPINLMGGGGDFRGISMDGLTRNDPPEELQDAHHDFGVAPGGVIVTGVHEGGCDAIKEWSPAGGTKVLVANTTELYTAVGDCHANAWDYQEDTDTWTFSDRNPSLFIKIDRDGSLIWQFGGADPLGPLIEPSESWSVNHGHHYAPGGSFLFFNNGQGQNSPVLEFAIDEQALSGTKVWEYTSGHGSVVLGDVQRLPNGHTLVTYSNDGTIQEIDGSSVVGEITAGSGGYVDWRPSLYGPPAL